MGHMIKRAVCVALIFCSTPVRSDQLGDAVAAYNRGEYQSAVTELSIMAAGGDRRAKFNMGFMAEQGHVPRCDLGCAIDWYKQAGRAGIPFGYTKAGILQFNAGLKSDGLGDLTTAARYNEPQARTLLAQMKKFVPEPDYYNEEQQRIAERDEQERARLSALAAQQQQAALIAQQQAAEQARADAENDAAMAILGASIGSAIGSAFYRPLAPTSVRVKTTCRFVGKQIYCN